MAAYITSDDIQASNVGYDFSSYDSEILTGYAELATEIVENFTGRKFGAGPFIEKSETKVDRQGRIVIRTRNKNIAAVTLVEVWVPGSQKITLNTTYLDLYKTQGYMYYNTQASIGWAMHGAYPSVVLTRMNKLSYEITYTCDATIPGLVKQACLIIVGNLLKSDYIFKETGVAGMKGDVRSFTSGEYTVGFQINNPNKNSSGGMTTSDGGANEIVTPAVLELLSRYRSVGQNTY